MCVDDLYFQEEGGSTIYFLLFFLLGLGIVFVLAWAYVCTFSPTRLRAPGNLLSNIFVYPPYEVAMPSETNSTKERQNVRNAWSRALRALETPEEKLVRREIRNEKDRARRRRAKTKQK